MSLIVIAHEHDEHGRVYRLTVGYEVTEEQVVVDADGQPVYATADPDERPADEQPLTELVVVDRVPTEDFVWSDTDDRWKDRTDAQIAASQLQSVRAALAKRDAAAEAEAEARKVPRPLVEPGRSV